MLFAYVDIYQIPEMNFIYLEMLLLYRKFFLISFVSEIYMKAECTMDFRPLSS